MDKFLVSRDIFFVIPWLHTHQKNFNNFLYPVISRQNEGVSVGTYRRIKIHRIDELKKKTQNITRYSACCMSTCDTIFTTIAVSFHDTFAYISKKNVGCRCIHEVFLLYRL